MPWWGCQRDGITSARDRQKDEAQKSQRATLLPECLQWRGFSRKSTVQSRWLLVSSELLTHRHLLFPAWPRARLCVPQILEPGPHPLLCPLHTLPPFQGPLCHCDEVSYAAHAPRDLGVQAWGDHLLRLLLLARGGSVDQGEARCLLSPFPPRFTPKPHLCPELSTVQLRQFPTQAPLPASSLSLPAQGSLGVSGAEHEPSLRPDLC